MPLPLLFIGIAAATGLAGAGKTVKAVVDNTNANKINTAANEGVDNARKRLEQQRGAVAQSLEKLGEEKLQILAGTVTSFVSAFEKIKNIDFTSSVGLEELEKLHIDQKDFEELKELGNFAIQVAGGVTAGAAGGALTAIGAYGAAQTFAAASTGTAIASLSGAAATNATLAFFGGGSLAAGGLGMAGGMMVLGGLVAGPALLVMGLITGAKSQEKLDQALLNQENAAADDKVDLFLAEADYIQKYTGSDFTQDVTKLGVTDFSNTYAYTVQCASDANGVVKGVSFQCCPAALIYRRSIAQDVLGTDDPAEVQKALSDWTKFNEVAAKAKEKGYYMTASESATYRVFSNNVTEPWVDADNNLQIPEAMKTWMQQAKDFTDKGYTQTCDIWSDECTAQMFGDGKVMCYFGPAWYYNFSMGNAQDAEKGCYGDWAICEGPQAHFWGGTWLLAPTGTDNPTMVADIMNLFINDEETCSKLVSDDMQFSNNQAVNAKFASDPNFGNAFLGGQNDTAIYVELAKNIVFENHTIYDQLINEDMQKCWREYCDGDVSEEQAMANFYAMVSESYPTIVTP